MSATPLARNSLILYKQGPARVHETDPKRITIALQNGELIRVRPKDVTLLHPGPIMNLDQLGADAEISADLLVAWELLAGRETNLRELVELAYGEFTPGNSWSVWKEVADGLYFRGDPDHITVSTEKQVQQEKQKREEREKEQQAWEAFVQRVAAGRIIEEDNRYLSDIEALALGRQTQSRVLRALGREQTPENAHDVLLKVGYWDMTVNPYPVRAGVPLIAAAGDVPSLPQEPRRDLTHLIALAIDDEGNEDPDDALSWDNGRLWVHIADVAALIQPDSLLDLEARDRGANLYLPGRTISMLPQEVTAQLGLGLLRRSPALSIGMDINADGQIEEVEIVPSWVNVTRWSYSETENRLTEDIPAQLLQIADIYQKRRREAGAVEINLPEVRVRLQEDEISIKPILPLRSRDMVREAMLMAGEAVALFAQSNDIAIAYTIQDAPTDELPELNSMSSMFAARKMLKPSRQSTESGMHSGLGMRQYAQVTSPLRRYLDLVIHQQIRAVLLGQPTLSQQEILDRIGATNTTKRELRRVERLSQRHWTLAYLLQNPEWQGEGIVVERHGRRHVTSIPDLDIDTDLYLPDEQALDSKHHLKIQHVDLPLLQTRFAVIPQQIY